MSGFPPPRSLPAGSDDPCLVVAGDHHPTRTSRAVMDVRESDSGDDHGSMGTSPHRDLSHHSRYNGACLRWAIIKTRTRTRISRHLAACLRGAMINDSARLTGSSSYPDKPGSDGIFATRMLVMIMARWGQAHIVAGDDHNSTGSVGLPKCCHSGYL